MPDHPHSAIARRLKRANGHLETIIEMIEQDRPCAQVAQQLLAGFPATAPGMVIVQHMPAAFTTEFAKRLHNDSRIELEVGEARQHEGIPCLDYASEKPAGLLDV